MSVTRHEITFSVRSYELDSYRHVNNAAYINWLEEARECFLRSRGQDWSFYPDRLELWFVVARIDCEYRAAAHAADRLRCTTRLAALGRTSVVFRQVVRGAEDDRVRCRARVVMVFADSADRPAPIPPAFLEEFGIDPAGDAWTDQEGGERAMTPPTRPDSGQGPGRPTL